MVRDVFVVGSLAVFGTLVFSLILGFAFILLPVPFLVLIIPLSLAGQLVFAMHIEEIAIWFGYKFKD